MAFEGRRAMRTTFDLVAQDYDRFRPGYPEQVFVDLVEVACLWSGARLLEIGCGSGHATTSLAERGLAIVALEPGVQLSALARRRLAAFPAVAVVTATFEDWDAQGERSTRWCRLPPSTGLTQTSAT